MELKDLDFLQLLPQFMRSDKAVQGLAAAVNELMPLFYEKIKLYTTWDKIDELPESELDELAWELNIAWYDFAASLPTKRRLIKQSDLVYARLGTKWAVEQVIQSYFGNGNISEWFEYDGDPHHFRIETDNVNLSDGAIERFLRHLEIVKRKSSWLDGIHVILRSYLQMYVGLVLRETTTETYRMVPSDYWVGRPTTRTVTGLVWPVVSDNLGLGDEYLRKHDIVVELRATFNTPAPAGLSTTAVYTGSNDEGRFTIEDVPFGNYILYIKRPGYLVRCMPVTVMEGSAAIMGLMPPGSEGRFNLWGGDVNDDLTITSVDAAMVMGGMGITALDSSYSPAYDLNADGLIDNSDVLMVNENLSKDASQYPGSEGVDFGA